MNTRKEFRERFRELAPMIYYGDINENIKLCVLSKRPDDKVYAYCDAMLLYGDLGIIICITDGSIDCIYADNIENPDRILELQETILEKVRILGGRLDWYARYYQAGQEGNWPMKMGLDEKLTTGFIEAFIPSKDTAAYLRSINHEFSELEKATIISNHECIDSEEKIEALERMRELTENDGLKERLNKVLDGLLQGKYNSFLGVEAFHDFFPIPHDYRHGDIVRCIGSRRIEELGLIYLTDEEYESNRNVGEDYFDIQEYVQTPFKITRYRKDGMPYYYYRGEFSHAHVNPIYIERARPGHDNECALYLKYLASIGTPNENVCKENAQIVIAKQIDETWRYYPELNLAELIDRAGRIGKMWVCEPTMTLEELLELPKVKNVDVLKVKDNEIMDGLHYMSGYKCYDPDEICNCNYNIKVMFK